MGINKQEMKGGSLSALTGIISGAKKNERRFFSSDSSYTGFHNIVDAGDYIFRVCPPHDKGDAAYFPFRFSQLPVEVDEYKDGEKTGEKVVKNKKIFIATQHCDAMDVDPIELYIEYVMERANDEFDSKEDRKKFTAPIFGFRGKDKKWVWGITPSTEYVCYAFDTESKLGRLQLREGWLNDLLKAANDGEGEMPDVDPYSDPVEGHPFKITKQQDANKKWEYPIVKINPNSSTKETWEAFYERTALTESQMKELQSKEPLRKLYINSYTKRDFDLALEGLRRFDKKWEYGIFNNTEFIEKLEELALKVPADPEQENEDKKSGKDIEQAFTPKANPQQAAKPTAKAKQVDSEPEFNPLMPKYKRALKTYLKSEYGEDEAILAQVPSDFPTLEAWYTTMMEGEELPLVFDEPVAETEEAEETKAVEEETTEEESEEDFVGDESQQAFEKQLEALRRKRQG